MELKTPWFSIPSFIHCHLLELPAGDRSLTSLLKLGYEIKLFLRCLVFFLFFSVTDAEITPEVQSPLFSVGLEEAPMSLFLKWLEDAPFAPRGIPSSCCLSQAVATSQTILSLKAT